MQKYVDIFTTLSDSANYESDSRLYTIVVGLLLVKCIEKMFKPINIMCFDNLQKRDN